jgi:hypothetical protein
MGPEPLLLLVLVPLLLVVVPLLLVVLPLLLVVLPLPLLEALLLEALLLPGPLENPPMHAPFEGGEAGGAPHAGIVPAVQRPTLSPMAG